MSTSGMSPDTRSEKGSHSSSSPVLLPIRVSVLLSVFVLISLLGLLSCDASPVHVHRRLMPFRRHYLASSAISGLTKKGKMISSNSSRGIRDISTPGDEMGRLNPAGGSGYTFTFMRQQGNRTLTRKESQDSSGFLKGIYWIQDPNGIFRLISYEADPDQRFQAQVLTNRPGEVNVTFPSDFPIRQQPPPVSVMTTTTTTATKRQSSSRPPPATNRPDEASLSSFSARMRKTGTNQVSSNCSAAKTPLIAPEDLLMTTGIPVTDSDMTPVSTTEMKLEFGTFTPTTPPATTSIDPDPDDMSGHVHVHHDSDEDDDHDDDEDGYDVTKPGSIDDHRSGNNSQSKDPRERAKLIGETTTTNAVTTTTAEEISDSGHETTSGISMSTTDSGGDEEDDVTSTTTSSYSTTFGEKETSTESVTTLTAVTTTTAEMVTEEADSRPLAPVSEQQHEREGSPALSHGALSALRYFLEYRIELMNGGPSIYRKEGTDSQGKVIGSYMFLVHDKDEDINHKREQLTKKNNMTQELIKIIQV